MKKLITCILILLLIVPVAVPARAEQAINEVNITVYPPTILQSPSFIVRSVLDETGYVGMATAVNINWFQVDPGKAMGTLDAFELGKVYEVTVRLKAKYDYKFTFDSDGAPCVKATVNGQPATVSAVYGYPDQVDVHYQFEPVADDLMQQADVTGIDAPVAGKLADYTARIDSDDYRLQRKFGYSIYHGITWYDVTDGQYVSTKQSFIDGHVYTVEVHLAPTGNKLFSENVTGTINGIEVEAVNDTGYDIYLHYTFPACGQSQQLPESTEAVPEPENTEEVTVHQHQWEDTFGYCDEQGHAHNCLDEDCTEHDQLHPHQPEKGKCTLCGYGQELPEAQKPANNPLPLIIIIAALLLTAGIVAIIIKKRKH